MIRVHVICEGQTEETFINEVLYAALYPRDICLNPSLVGKPGHKGGNLRLERLFKDIRARLLGDTSAYCTTFFDFYGLPNDFPGKTDAKRQQGSREKAQCLLAAFTAELKSRLGDDPLRRFIPYVQLHEFEGLLFSDTTAFAAGIGHKTLAGNFAAIRREFESPEDINDGPLTAPSKRIKKLFTMYEKPLHGSLGAMEVGLGAIRKECLLFDEWLKRIEALSAGGKQ